MHGFDPIDTMVSIQSNAWYRSDQMRAFVCRTTSRPVAAALSLIRLRSRCARNAKRHGQRILLQLYNKKRRT
jgi:hypothetical protein